MDRSTDSAGDFADCWLLASGDLRVLRGRSGVPALGLAVLLKFFRWKGRFPRAPFEVPAGVVDFLAEQLGVDPDLYVSYRWSGTTIE